VRFCASLPTFKFGTGEGDNNISAGVGVSDGTEIVLWVDVDGWTFMNIIRVVKSIVKVKMTKR
jgi:hypothetical protein